MAVPLIGRGAAVAALALAAVLPVAAQTRRPPAPTPEWRWFASADIGLVGREIATWNPVHRALAPTVWDAYVPNLCQYFCPNAAEIVQGRPAAGMVALRGVLDGVWQLRLMAARATPGHYPGAYLSVPLTIEPTTTTVAAQLAGAVGGFWFAAGPSYYRGTVATTAGTAATTSRRNGVGLVLSAGATWPRTTPWFFEAVAERRVAGSVVTSPLPVSGAPDVPAVTMPLSATVLSLGVGWRL